MKFNDNFFKKNWVAYSIGTCSAVILYMILSNLSNIGTGIGKFCAFIEPVALGAIIAYVFNPFANFFEKSVLKGIKNEKTRWLLSVILSLIVLLVCLVLLFVALIPQLAESIMTLVSNMDVYMKSLQTFLHNLEKSTGSGFFKIDLSSLANFGDTILEYMSSFLTDNIGNVALKSANIGKGIVDILLALIVAIYFLMDKKRIIGNLSRFISLIMKKEKYEKTCNYLSRCNDILIRYIGVDVIDGVAVGFINFVFMLIMKMPYASLISVIVGVTNLAPTFGPIVGAALGAFILVLVEPWQALWFLIFTIVLQTVDGYILKPRLFGGSLGVSSLMIIISIILGGRLFGVAGILIAIPFAAILDFTWKDFVIKRLEERHNKRYTQ